MKHEHRDATLQLLTKRLQTHSLLTFLASSSLPAALTSPLPNVTEISKCKTRAIFSLPGTRVLKPLFWFFSADFTEGQSKERGHKDGVDKDISSFVIMFIVTCGLLGVMVIVTVAVNIYRKKKSIIKNPNHTNMMESEQLAWNVSDLFWEKLIISVVQWSFLKLRLLSNVTSFLSFKTSNEQSMRSSYLNWITVIRFTSVSLLMLIKLCNYYFV